MSLLLLFSAPEKRRNPFWSFSKRTTGQRPDKRMLPTKVAKGTGAAVGTFIGGDEGTRFVVDLGQEEVEVVEEFVLHHGNVGDGGLAENKGGVVVVGASVLDE